jgi:hypothetical protein
MKGKQMNKSTKIQVQIHYRNASGQVHTSGASFDDMASMATAIENFFGVQNIVSIEFTK